MLLSLWRNINETSSLKHVVLRGQHLYTFSTENVLRLRAWLLFVISRWPTWSTPWCKSCKTNLPMNCSRSH